MKNLILIFILCIGLVNAFSFPKFFPRLFPRRNQKKQNIDLPDVSSPNEIRKQQDAQEIKDLTSMNQPDRITRSWFNFTLIYFYNADQHVAIRHQDEFFQIQLVYKPKYKNVFVIHGWQNKFGVDIWLDQIKDMIFREHGGKVNVFIVDWSKFAASRYYATSATFTKILGKQLAEFIAFLKTRFAINEDKVHLIGHSLGAHAAGFTGKQVQKKNFKIGKITGLDPAGPSFTTKDPRQRLDRRDAKLVEVLHTNMGSSVPMGLGIAMKIGHVDIFLNGGSRQKGCYAFLPDQSYDNYFPFAINKIPDDSPEYKNKTWSKALFCHHSRAVDFYLETRRQPCQAVAYACDNYKNFLDGKCSYCGARNEKCRLFGYSAKNDLLQPPKYPTSYFLNTNGKDPLCANHYQIELEIDSSSVKYGEFVLTVKGQRASASFELKGEWNRVRVFTAVVTTEKQLGPLVSATGSFRTHWYERDTKEIEFVSMSVVYMSNINNRMRDRLSADFIVQESSNNFHKFKLDDESDYEMIA